MEKTKIILKNPKNKYLKEYSAAIRRGMKVVHVVPHEKGWAVKKSVSKSSKVFSTKTVAVAYASQLASKSKSDYITYSKDCVFQKRVTPKR